MQNKGVDFTKLQGATLIATFFSLWLAVYFEHAVENLFAYILISSVRPLLLFWPCLC